MNRHPNEKLLLPTGHKIKWKNAKILEASEFVCYKCKSNTQGFRVHKLAKIGSETDVVFCVNCISIVWKPAFFGSKIASCSMPVEVWYENGQKETLTTLFGRGAKKINVVMCCGFPMVRYRQSYESVFESLEQLFECMSCKCERIIITNAEEEIPY